ncbi:MAG: DUF2185 domain-containing protein [Planctomycetota bacterium]
MLTIVQKLLALCEMVEQVQSLCLPVMTKNFKDIEIVSLAEGHGACFATDMITCDGMPVRFMYRETPDNDIDSGWRFTAGIESDDYMDDPENSGIYDVNTISNYDPDIIPFFELSSGTAVERNANGEFEIVNDFEPPVE